MKSSQEVLTDFLKSADIRKNGRTVESVKGKPVSKETVQPTLMTLLLSYLREHNIVEDAHEVIEGLARMGVSEIGKYAKKAGEEQQNEEDEIVAEMIEELRIFIKKNIIAIGHEGRNHSFYSAVKEGNFVRIIEEPCLGTSTASKRSTTFAHPELNSFWDKINDELKIGQVFKIRNAIERLLANNCSVTTRAADFQGNPFKSSVHFRSTCPFAFHGKNKYFDSSELGPRRNEAIPVTSVDISEFTLGNIDAWLQFVTRVHRPFDFCLAIADLVTPAVPPRKTLYLKGDGRDGKSVVVDALSDFLGGVAFRCNGKIKIGTHDTDLLVKSSLLILQEADFAEMGRNPTVKAIATGERMTINAKFKDVYEAPCECKIVSHSNKLSMCRFYLESEFSRFDGYHIFKRKEKNSDIDFPVQLKEQVSNFVLFCLLLKKSYLSKQKEKDEKVKVDFRYDCGGVEDYRLGQFSGVGACGLFPSQRKFWSDLLSTHTIVKMSKEQIYEFGLDYAELVKDFVRTYYAEVKKDRDEKKALFTDEKKKDTVSLTAMCQGLSRLILSKGSESFDEDIHKFLPLVPKEFAKNFEEDEYWMKRVGYFRNPFLSYNDQLSQLQEEMDAIYFDTDLNFTLRATEIDYSLGGEVFLERDIGQEEKLRKLFGEDSLDDDDEW